MTATEHAGPLASQWRTWRTPILVSVLCIAVLRVMTEVVALVSRYGSVFPHVLGRDHHAAISVWSQWDANIYAALARFGYPAGALVPGHQNPIAFAPLFPWIERAASDFTGLGIDTAGLLVALLSTVIGVALVYRVVAIDFGAQSAGTTVVLLLAWPSAFFLLTGYADSVAMAAVAGALLAARRGQWIVAGIACALAGMAKYYAVVVLVAVLVEWWQHGGRADRKRATVELAALVVPTVLFFAAWMDFCASRMHSALAFVHAQAAWGRRFGWPWVLAWHTLLDLVHLRFLDTSHASAVELFDAVTVVVLAVAVVSAWRSLRKSWAVLLGIVWAVYVFETILVSESREVLMFFPFFAVLALWCRRWVWLERLLLALWIPSAYFLVERFVTLKFAG
ncbi:MAG: glycosyltransferase family 39 protein [Acidimicrobiales bacterium]